MRTRTAKTGHSEVERGSTGVVPELRRAWLILLLDACERAGLTPITAEHLHRLAYFANCLAPVYQLPAADGKILKYQRGPFYPDLQWDIDRVVVMRLLERRNARLVRDEFGAWFTAEYVLSPLGVAATDVIRQSPRRSREFGFFVELASAYSTLGESARSSAALEDATYSDPAARLNTIIDFGEWEEALERNRSAATAAEFDRYAPPSIRLGRRDRLHLYFQYLERAVDASRRGAKA